jgi:hypothetical protein
MRHSWKRKSERSGAMTACSYNIRPGCQVSPRGVQSLFSMVVAAIVDNPPILILCVTLLSKVIPFTV